MSRIVDVFVPLDASDEPLASLISRTLGIPREQLDFQPHTVEQIEEMFSLSLADLG